MAEKQLSKIIFGGETLIDLTGDTVSADQVHEGLTFHDKSGAILTGTSTLDSDTSDATVAVAEILEGKTGYARGAKITGTMPNNGGFSAELQGKNKPVNIPQGYHDGSGKVRMNDADAAKLIPENVRQGVEILDITGTMTGLEDVNAQSKTVTPNKTGFTVLPEEPHNYLSQVKVDPIPYVLTDNAAGGQTATIG